VGSLAVHPPDAAASLAECYRASNCSLSILSPFTLYHSSHSTILPHPCCLQNDVKLPKRCSPQVADTCSATQEIPYLLRNPKVDFGVHKRSPGSPILSPFCIVSHSMPSSSFRLHDQNLYAIHVSLTRAL